MLSSKACRSKSVPICFICITISLVSIWLPIFSLLNSDRSWSAGKPVVISLAVVNEKSEICKWEAVGKLFNGNCWDALERYSVRSVSQKLIWFESLVELIFENNPVNNAMQGLCGVWKGCPYGTRTDLAAGAAVAPHGLTARVSCGSNYLCKLFVFLNN